MQNEQHPVSREMRTRIQRELKRIEEIHNVKIIYACESGSRGWGFASTNSDYDVRFVYVNHPRHYVRIDLEAKETIEHIVDKELDICGWNITKTLKLVYKSNPTFLEWLQSPIVYFKDEEDFNELKKQALRYFVHITGYEHYMSMAKATQKEFLSGDTTIMKKYFYALRPLLAALWVDKKMEVPPMVFQDLLPIIDDAIVLKAIDDLVTMKRLATEKERIPNIKVLDDFIMERLSDHRQSFPEYDRPEIFDLSNFGFDLVTKYRQDLRSHLVVKENGQYVHK